MITTEQKIEHSTGSQQGKFTSSKKKAAKGMLPSKNKPSDLRFFISKQSFFFFSYLTLGFLLGAVYFFHNQMLLSTKDSLKQFEWVVLIQGDQLTVDEAGRFLKQFDGVESVQFLSSERLSERIQSEGVAEEDLSLLKSVSLPPAWVVSWSENAPLLRTLPTVLSDIQNFPGVMDVSYDRDALNDMGRFQYHAYQIKLVLAVLYACSVLLGVLVLGRVVFFSNVTLPKLKELMPISLIDFVGWQIGIMLCYQVMGTIDWFKLFMIGIPIAMLRPLLNLAYDKE